MTESSDIKRERKLANFLAFTFGIILSFVVFFVALIALSESAPAIAAEQRANQKCECRGGDCEFAVFRVEDERRAYCLIDHRNADDSCCFVESR